MFPTYFKGLLILAFFFISETLRAQVNTDKRLAGIEMEINRILKAQHAAGVAVAVVERNKVVYAKGFGYRDVENKLPVTENTQFAIGSCTKAFTSSLLGILQKSRSIDLDKPATQYLPDLKFYNDQLTAQVTLRDMMCHRTGLPRHDLSWYIDPDERAALVKRIQYMEPSAELRARWQYNNFMFLLQGVVAEKLTGSSWESVMADQIFSRIGMSHSNFSVKDLAKYKEPALGYNVIRDSVIHRMPYYEIGGMGPAGSINSTVLDMAQWLKVWINGGKLDTVEIIPASYVTEATSSQMIVGPGTPTPEKPDILFSNYGFGWFLASYKGHYRVEHGGNIDGFSANTSFYPTDSIGIVVLANQNGSAVPSIVRNTIVDRMLGLKYFDWNADVTKATAKAKEAMKEAEKNASSNQVRNTRPSHEPEAYVGIYANDGYGKFEVQLKGDSLFVQTKHHRWWLQHYHYDIFRPFDTEEGIDTANPSPIRFHFTTGLKGDIESAALFEFEPALKVPITFKRANAVKEMGEQKLKKYAGVFELAGTQIKTYLKDKTLYVLVPGQPEYELVPVGQDRFDFKKVSGYSVLFQLDEKGELASLTFQQPNGNFKAVIKK